MRYRRLGRTNLEVSEVGFGSWGIGGGMWAGSDDREALRALHAAADHGVNFYDRALVYGRGHSERLVGKFLAERRNSQVRVATKVPPLNDRWPASAATPLAAAFPYGHIIACTERSLHNLGVATIDLLQFHVWLDAWVDQAEWYEAVVTLKEEGKIRHFGLSINDHQPESALKAVTSGKVDTLQVIYNIYDQSPDEDLFSLCQHHDVGIIARVPFDEGGLLGTIRPDTEFPAGDWRNRYFRGERKQEVFEHTELLRSLLGAEAQSLPELALRFCLSHPAVSTVIPGMRSLHHVVTNCAVSDGRTLSPRMLEELRVHAWKRNYYS
jgi:aryl-alcohol dehydrogenase-like predicted oxidoreductase